MKRCVDADKILEIASGHKDFEQSIADLTSLKEVLEDTPSIVKTIVHCEDCKRYATNTELLGNVCNRLFTVFPMKPDDFCSYGERKDEE